MSDKRKSKGWLQYEQEADQIAGRVNPSNVTVKMLDGTAVFCQHDGCEKRAVYLFSAATFRRLCAAHCSQHAQDFANRLGINLLGRRLPRPRRRLKASA